MVNAVDWLLASDEPLIRYRARTWLLGASERNATVRADRDAAPDGPVASTLLAIDDRARKNPYRKWSGLHWRLVALADLGLPTNDRGTRATLDAGIDRELSWIATSQHLDAIPRIDGLYRADASMEGNALYAASRFGHATDDRARRLAAGLLEWQWPDGGWNCDRASSGHRSSFHESWATAIGLAEYARATGENGALAAARRTGELLLEHRLFRRLRDGEPIHTSFRQLHWPPYWHYDYLGGLRMLRAVGMLDDERATDALDLLAAAALPDGRYQAPRAWWQAPTRATSAVDVVDWGRGEPAQALTLQVLSILKEAGRLPGAASRKSASVGGQRAMEATTSAR